ncbi:MAG: hypothetical protein RL645_1062 [Actinomycetota bacterium]|jgi:hypothetical protein
MSTKLTLKVASASLIALLGASIAGFEPANAAFRDCLVAGEYRASEIAETQTLCQGVSSSEIALKFDESAPGLGFPEEGQVAIADFAAGAAFSEIVLVATEHGSVGVLEDGVSFGDTAATLNNTAATAYPGCGGSQFLYLPWTWTTTWSWRYNPSSQPNAGALVAIQEAANLWTTGVNRCTGIPYTSTFQNRYLGTTTRAGAATSSGTCGARDGFSVISWSVMPYGQTNGILALACLTPYGATATEADITFNPAYSYYTGASAYGCPSGYVDLREIAAHEVGHVTGMAHSDPALLQLMKPNFGPCETGERLLAPGDIAGLLNRY